MPGKRPRDRRMAIQSKPLGHARNPKTGKRVGVFWRNAEQRLVGDERTGTDRRVGPIDRRKTKAITRPFPENQSEYLKYPAAFGNPDVWLINHRKSKGRRATDK